MTDWEEQQAKVRAIHLGACVLLRDYVARTDAEFRKVVAQSASLYKRSEDAVLGPPNE